MKKQFAVMFCLLAIFTCLVGCSTGSKASFPETFIGAVGQEETGQEYVFTVENGRAVRRAVTLGAEDSELVQVLSGLTAGETVLLTPEEVPEGRCVTGAFS